MKANRVILLFTLLSGLCSLSLAQTLAPEINAALAHTDRSEADRARDEGRKPGQVFEFSGIKAGQTVVDLFSGGGYYTEILSRFVGDEGKVIAHNNSTYMSYVGDELKVRYGEQRLANVQQVVQEANDLDVGADVADAAFLVLAYHDIYYQAEGWPAIDKDKFLANIYRALKPNATLLVVDHRARTGAPPESGNNVHRIDPALVRQGLEAAGFIFEKAADFLNNPNDDLLSSVFEPAIQGKTSRFVHLYRKPAN
ncbi:MAG TPA: methyltransferase type 11 [Porticoccaceae bacterium]|nr:methyltransferase type 11 [Porticoccaceae bacterium]HCO59003.1 methyltransferase type 11 [Porticoccaceae bacterium]